MGWPLTLATPLVWGSIILELINGGKHPMGEDELASKLGPDSNRETVEAEAEVVEPWPY